MHTRSGKIYNPEEPNTYMDLNSFSSDITSPTDYITPIFKALEKLKAQINTLGQRMDRLEVERHDGGHNEERSLNLRREKRINRNYNRYDEDERYLRTSKWTYQTSMAA